MANIGLAAYDPLFFLHHANIDRIWASFIARNPDTPLEFEAFQNINAHVHKDKIGRVAIPNLWKLPLKPFHKPSGDECYPSDVWYTKPMGYVYDHLVPS